MSRSVPLGLRPPHVRPRLRLPGAAGSLRLCDRVCVVLVSLRRTAATGTVPAVGAGLRWNVPAGTVLSAIGHREPARVRLPPDQLAERRLPQLIIGRAGSRETPRSRAGTEERMARSRAPSALHAAPAPRKTRPHRDPANRAAVRAGAAVAGCTAPRSVDG